MMRECHRPGEPSCVNPTSSASVLQVDPAALLDRLHDNGCGREGPNQTRTNFDRYTALVLLFLFNPSSRPRAGWSRPASLDKVRRKLGVAPPAWPASPRPRRLRPGPIARDREGTGAQLAPLKHDARLDQVPGLLTLVDGTGGVGPGQARRALGQGKDGAANRDVKLHTPFRAAHGRPADIDLTKATDSEVDNLLGRLLPGRVYVKDRGYACFACSRGSSTSNRTSSAASATTASTT